MDSVTLEHSYLSGDGTTTSEVPKESVFGLIGRHILLQFPEMASKKHKVIFFLNHGI